VGETFLWHDYETFGADPRRDRPAQFAGIRTDRDLRPVAKPIAFYCRPARDVLPVPEASLVTRITPQRAAREGLAEHEFAARVHEALAEPGTCGAGYNSIRFDDEFTRNLLYRNFHDPYAREWQHGNSRWDLIDLMRLCYALRPDGIEWPEHDACMPSFRLADLAERNGIAHANAHDALSDVEATLALARLVRERQPRLFDYFLGMRDKRRALALLDWVGQAPVLHASSRYPARRGCLAMIAPLAPHPTQNNAVIVYDLDADPAALIELGDDDLRDRLFTPRADLPEGVERLALKVVRANHCPALAPLSVLANVDVARIGLDPDRCARHAERLRAAPDVPAKVARLFGAERATRDPEDADLALYSGGFLADVDREQGRLVRNTPPEALAALESGFRDARCRELLFRYRARNFPESLSPTEQERWREHRRARLMRDAGLGLTIEQYRTRIAKLRGDGADTAILDSLEDWGNELVVDL
jgi:exodeoxyribonuclease I